MVGRLLVILVLSLATSAGAQFGWERQYDIAVNDGSMDLPNAWSGGMNYCQFSNIDFNFDGVQDVFAFDRSCNQWMCFIQNGSSGSPDLVYAPEYESLFPQDMKDWVLLADYNCDGLPDVFTSAIGGCRVFVNTGDAGTGHSFELASPILATSVEGTPGYMFFSSVDIPAIVDVDGDSDLDVLNFGVLSTAVEYHKNMSMELYGTCDSLVFETKNECWGLFTESDTSNDMTLWDTTTFPCQGTLDNPEFPLEGGDRQDRHAGSSLLALDMDNSSTMDLLIGDITFKNMSLLMNSGTAPNTNSGMESQETNFPSSSVPVNVDVFPAAFHLDWDNDGIRDLLVAPASVQNSNNQNGVWAYRNVGTESFPIFEYVDDDFAQETMIDVGKKALPVFFDQNGDGLKDLLVSVHEQYDPGTGDQISRIAYFENTGMPSNPEFTLVTEDWQNLSTLGIGVGLSFYPSFGDMDNDGDEDMILGEFEGKCHYFENTGTSGGEAVFTTFEVLQTGDGAEVYSGTTFAYPCLVDLDRDADLDLVVGRRDGKLNYYENTGTTSAYSFEKISSNWGLVDVSLYWEIEGQAIPQFVDVDGTYYLILGSKTGYLHYYKKVEGNFTTPYVLADPDLQNIHHGTYSAPAIADIDGDGTFEMIVGNDRGGLVLYESADLSLIGLDKERSELYFNMYPNPAQHKVTLDFGDITAEERALMSVQLMDLQGRELATFSLLDGPLVIDLSHLSNGTYLVNAQGPTGSAIKKLMIHQ